MDVPTLYQWIGGADALDKLTAEFYKRVKMDPVLRDVFAGMDERHPQFVAAFIGEVFGGPEAYTVERGGHAHMIGQHLNRHLTEPQRRRWMALLQDAYDDLELPADPEFASALVAYFEWGSRLAVLNSQPGVQVEKSATMPKWGWGVPGGPYVPDRAVNEVSKKD